MHAALAGRRSLSRPQRTGRAMRRHGIPAAVHRRFGMVTANRNHGLSLADNLLARDQSADCAYPSKSNSRRMSRRAGFRRMISGVRSCV
jgi:hypothetical protein